MSKVRFYFIVSLWLASMACISKAGAQPVWQWAVQVDSVWGGETNNHPTAFLWIPEGCKKVRAVVFGQHNMLEEGVLEHDIFRNAMRRMGIAEVWVTPGINMPFDFNKDAGEDFERMMDLLAEKSGYGELRAAPVVPLGHSAYASFPWNFAAWNPARTLALVSVHGDAPQTNLTGYGGKNVDWGKRNIDGVPALFIMGEYEWWQDRMTPALRYMEQNPKSAISLFCDAGHGHFDYSDEMIQYVCAFISKAAKHRLDADGGALKPVDPQKGWLMDGWRKDSLPVAKAAPYSKYKGDRRYASWVFDKKMADITENFYAASRGKMQQYLGFMQNGKVLAPVKSHANFQLPFLPLNDGVSFHLNAFFADSSRMRPAGKHAAGAIGITRICGPLKKINDTTFSIQFDKLGFDNVKRSNVIWLLASNKGDDGFKAAVQQAELRFPLWNKEGMPQHIIFDSLPNQMSGAKAVPLRAVSSVGMPVSFYIKEGPAVIFENRLVFTKVPPRPKWPIKITVVAWQYGRASGSKVQSAIPVENSFYLNK